MSRLLTSTRGLPSWRDRLANPGLQWKRYCSAFETAVSWESAWQSQSGLPPALENLLCTHGFANPILLLAVAEHQVELPGGRAASQSDVWALINTAAGVVSMTVEAKAAESFGDETLGAWLVAGKSERSITNRKARWDYISANLPASDAYQGVPYQILHRCAAAVIEAKRMACPNAMFVVQAFNTPDISFADFTLFCSALNLSVSRGQLAKTAMGGISLGVGWIDCPVATDADVIRVIAR
jgi:hypothetical protein